ncbi:MAG: chorismate-binding protein [Bdellovibrionota bacterium]
MKPLICFYQDDQYIYSDNYAIHTCKADQNVSDFLNLIEASFKKELKVVQINFEYNTNELFLDKKELYAADKATIFIINQHEIFTAKQLINKIPSTMNPLTHQFKILEEKESFKHKVEIIKKEISAGRIYQVNLTAPLVSETNYTPEKIFKNYFEKFGGSYKALLPLPSCDLISFSPELFLKKQQRKLKTQPIKGSLPINSDFAKDLLENNKEEAELSMIVDLLRNDFNRIETEFSSKVSFHREALQLGYIQHTYSEIEIETDKSLAQILEVTFPGGSISGCPKTESLEVIAELETYKRQAYTGTLGWWKDNNFSLNLTIRTFIKVKNQLFYHSGCGIVYDSDPEKEWNEFILKTGHLSQTLNTQK